jgi:hypothetical protein
MFFKFLAGITNPADLDRMVEQFKRGMETPVQSAPGAEFGERLKEACKRRVNAMQPSRVASASQDSDSFGSKLTEACKRRVQGMRH